MSWLNLNQSLNSLKGQITNFASEVLSEGPELDSGDTAQGSASLVKELEDKCRIQELEIASLKKTCEELQSTLQSERLIGKNGVKDEESSWYWDPPPQSKILDEDKENDYKLQIQILQDEVSSLRDRDAVDLKTNDEEIVLLREENRNLTNNLEDLDSQHQLAMERLLSLKKELQKNFEVLKDEHEDLKNTNDEYNIEIKTLQRKLEERYKEIETLKSSKSDYDTLQHKYQNLERIYSLLRENAEKFQEENQELHEEVFKLQEQVTKLEHEVEITVKHSDSANMVPRENFDELVKEINNLKSRRKTDLVDMDEINIDDNAKSVIENLKRDINELRYKLSERENDDQGSADHKTIKSEKIMFLYNKYVNFELPVDYVGEIPSSDDGVVLFKLESAFKTLNSFKKEIDVLEQKLSEKNLNINHLQTQIDDLTTENDFLTTDLQHFERELNEMKKNNDFLISEIAALKNTSKLEPIIETHEDNMVRLENELADSNKMNKTFESEIKKIEKQLAEVTTEKITLQESLNDLKQKYTSMLNELDICKNQTNAVEELEHNATAVYAEKLNKTTDEIDSLKKRLSVASAKNEELAIDIHILENDKVLLTKEVDDLKHVLEQKSTEHKEMEALKVSLEHKLQDLERKLDEVIKHKSELETDKLRLEENLSLLSTEIKSSKNDSIYLELEKITTEKTALKDELENSVVENLTLKETIDKLKSENSTLQNIQPESNKNLSETTEFQRTIEELTLKLSHQDELNREILKLKEDNNKLLERKAELETELSSTDDKILKLEEEFDKLVSDMNEKDAIINDLNHATANNDATILHLKQNILELEKKVISKTEDISRLTTSFSEISEKLNITCQNETQILEKYNALAIAKDNISAEIVSLKEELESKNIEISAMKIHLEELKMENTSHKKIVDLKEKEIKELKQSIVEVTDKIKNSQNVTQFNDEYAKLVEEKEAIKMQFAELTNNLTLKEQDLTIIKTKCEELEKTCLHYKTGIDNVVTEKNELINLVNLKHNESVQYHGEIQRLNNILLEQTNEFKKIVEEKEKLLKKQNNCSNCEKLRITLKEKDEIIKTVNQNLTEYENLKAELLQQNEITRGLTEKCESLNKNLGQQLETLKNLTTENAQLVEKEENAARELERLRRHLVETEESYTQELMSSEQKLTECQARLHQVEERAKQSSTVYTSNSIRANQEVETLRNQIKLLEKQREEVQTRLSDAEDSRSRSEAALINLQVVLEQFQLDKERDIHGATEKIRNKLEDMKRENGRLQEEVQRLNIKLEESLAGLQAASRLGDQVETKTAQINDLKEQVSALQTSVAAAEERYHKTISNQQDKVDKNLVKNLVINYVLAATQNNHNRNQVLRVLSTVLDFNQQECEKLGLVRGNATESLAAEFVKFLQQESKPRPALPGMIGLSQNPARSATPSSRKNSGLGPQPNTFDAGHRRNPSTGSNNLLFQNIDNLDTTSQISLESDTSRAVSVDTGVNQLRNTEGAILKHVLKDM